MAEPKLNVKNILRLAEVIESGVYGFDMSVGYRPTKKTAHSCGSAACIGGTAAAVWPSVRIGAEWDEPLLQKKLGITYDQHSQLCFLRDVPLSYYQVTRRMAVEVLRRLARTGKVKWGKPRKKREW